MGARWGSSTPAISSPARRPRSRRGSAPSFPATSTRSSRPSSAWPTGRRHVLAELRVTNLGIVEEITIALGPGLTAITGETGAGKTLLVEALELLLGRRADPGLVRDGASEARVEGRFVGPDDDEHVLARVLPADGRSRAYVDGRLATAAELAEIGATLVDLHGQHAHQHLLVPAVQRAVLDRFAGDA